MPSLEKIPFQSTRYAKAGLREKFSDIYFYVVHRIESMFTLSNFQKMIQKKHLILKKVYDLELKIHKNNHKAVVRCLKSKMGASTETDAILDFRNPPLYFGS